MIETVVTVIGYGLVIVFVLVCLAGAAFMAWWKGMIEYDTPILPKRTDASE